MPRARDIPKSRAGSGECAVYQAGARDEAVPQIVHAEPQTFHVEPRPTIVQAYPLTKSISPNSAVSTHSIPIPPRRATNVRRRVQTLEPPAPPRPLAKFH